MKIEEKASARARRPFIRHLLRITAVIALAAYTMVFAELFVRFVAPQPIFPRYVTGAPWGVRGNIPGAHYWHTSSEVNVEFRINRWGMRDDRDFPLEKPPGTCRIAVFGDSFFMGYELDLKDSFSAKLEAKLRAQKINVEVLNFSVSGFGTAEMLRVYEAFGRKFSPELVIFQWHSTDLDDNVRSGLYRLESNQLVPGNPEYLPSIGVRDVLMRSSAYRWVADYSHLYNFLRERAAGAVKNVLLTINKFKIGTTAVGNTSNDYTEGVDPSFVALSTALLRKAKQDIEQESRDFVLVDIPDQLSRTSFKTSFDVLPRNLRNNVEAILPLDAFRAAAASGHKIFYEQGHGHLTPYAVDMIAQLTVEAVSKSPKLATCAAR